MQFQIQQKRTFRVKKNQGDAQHHQQKRERFRQQTRIEREANCCTREHFGQRVEFHPPARRFWFFKKRAA